MNVISLHFQFYSLVVILLMRNNQVMILMMSMFGTAMPTLLSFPEERPVFVREYSTNHYGVVAYFMSRLSMEALITFLQILGKCRGDV